MGYLDELFGEYAQDDDEEDEVDDLILDEEIRGMAAPREQMGPPAPAPNVRRAYQPPRAPAGKPGQPISALGPKDDELGDAIAESNRMRDRRMIGGGIARLFGMDRDVLQDSIDDADRPIEDFARREEQRRYGVQQDAARRGENREQAREQRLGQERSRQLDLEERRLTQQAADAAATREQRAAAQAALEQYRTRRNELTEMGINARRRRGGGGGGTAPGAPVSSAWVADVNAQPPLEIRQWADRDRNVASALRTPEGRAEVARNWAQLRRTQQGQVQVSAPTSQQSASDFELDRYGQRLGPIEEVAAATDEVNRLIAQYPPGQDIPGVGEVEGQTPFGSDPTSFIRGLSEAARSPESQTMRAALNRLKLAVQNELFGAALTPTERAEMAGLGLQQNATEEQIRYAVGRAQQLVNLARQRLQAQTPEDVRARYEQQFQAAAPAPTEVDVPATPTPARASPGRPPMGPMGSGVLDPGPAPQEPFEPQVYVRSPDGEVRPVRLSRLQRYLDRGGRVVGPPGGG